MRSAVLLFAAVLFSAARVESTGLCDHYADALDVDTIPMACLRSLTRSGPCPKGKDCACCACLAAECNESPNECGAKCKVKCRARGVGCSCNFNDVACLSVHAWVKEHGLF